MRTHPLGIICLYMPLEETFQAATDYSLITHADPRCVVSCCIATGLIRGIVRGEIVQESEVDEMVEKSVQWVEGWLERHQNVGKAEDNAPDEEESKYSDYIFDKAELD